MKTSNPAKLLSSFFTIVRLAGAGVILTGHLQAAELKVTQRVFTSPAEAVAALQSAVAAKDQAALGEIFGPVFRELLTGDAVQDANNAQRFAGAMAQGCQPVTEGADKITLEIGTNHWPLPIPLLRVAGQWHFDTMAGKEEIINRHIGKDELNAIGVCRAYVAAQRQYAQRTSTRVGDGATYAQYFKSSPGKRDGLYWPVAETEPASPFGPLVAEAQADGYVPHSDAGPHPFHGYYFRILTRQGPAAPGGKMEYLTHNELTRGFALVAYPEHWDRSGIMTFIVNQDGNVFQRNLRGKTARIAGAMLDYNPDRDWKLVQDPGVVTSVCEK